MGSVRETPRPSGNLDHVGAPAISLSTKRHVEGAYAPPGVRGPFHRGLSDRAQMFSRREQRVGPVGIQGETSTRRGSVMRRIVVSLVTAVFGIGIAVAAPPKGIRSVEVDRQSLNVAAGETVTVTIAFERRGHASVVVVDRDGYPVRTLAKELPVS